MGRDKKVEVIIAPIDLEAYEKWAEDKTRKLGE